MSKLSVGDHSVENNQEAVEQLRLEALLNITTSHKKEMQNLKSQLEQAEKKARSCDLQIKTLESELKLHRASNPERMKKQVKRLQEQNRDILIENNLLKQKQKEMQRQVQNVNLELEKLRKEQKQNEQEKSCKVEEEAMET